MAMAFLTLHMNFNRWILMTLKMTHMAKPEQQIPVRIKGRMRKRRG